MNDVHHPTTPAGEHESSSIAPKSHPFWRVFWLAFLVASLAYAWYCFYVPSNRIAWADSYATAQRQAADAGKPMILFFTGEWCVPCRIMKREVWADEQVWASVDAAFIPVMIDVDDASEADVLSRYGIGTTPITIVTDSQGNVLDHRVGGMGRADFLAWLGSLDLPADEDA